MRDIKIIWYLKNVFTANIIHFLNIFLHSQKLNAMASKNKIQMFLKWMHSIFSLESIWLFLQIQNLLLKWIRELLLLRILYLQQMYLPLGVLYIKLFGKLVRVKFFDSLEFIGKLSGIISGTSHGFIRWVHFKMCFSRLLYRFWKAFERGLG